MLSVDLRSLSIDLSRFGKAGLDRSRALSDYVKAKINNGGLLMLVLLGVVLGQGANRIFIFQTTFVFIVALVERPTSLANIVFVTERTGEFVHKETVMATVGFGELVAG